MRLIFSDTVFQFPAIGGGHGVCEVRVYASDNGLEAVALIIEDDRNYENTSITNRATEIAELVSLEIRYLLAFDAVVRWVEIYANVLHPEPTFDWMAFSPGFERVTWRVGSRAEVEALIGSSITGIPDGDERVSLKS